ncbi:TniQ family protein [Streptomyces rhizosphaericus]|uniref:TniQ family protein n=1 Tax=Streptomyces rhizosphaericus TaxID=114699 RepID=UPI0027DED678|nr:TniQ family protein [Streptomyces cangkringensis]
MWPSPPGALRVQPLPRESTASYLTRLAATYQLTVDQLLDGLHIAATGTFAAPPATDIHLSAEATRRLSAFTRIPPAHLNRALPASPRPPVSAWPTPPSPAGSPSSPRSSRWRRAPPAPRTAARTRPSPRGSTRRPTCPGPSSAPATSRPPAIPGTPPPSTSTPPELTRTRPGARHRATTASLSWASTITTRWYDHHQHLHARWHTRLNRLTDANPHIPQGPASPALTCRNLITYPETLTLAAALDRLPRTP